MLVSMFLFLIKATDDQMIFRDLLSRVEERFNCSQYSHSDLGGKIGEVVIFDSKLFHPQGTNKDELLLINDSDDAFFKTLFDLTRGDGKDCVNWKKVESQEGLVIFNFGRIFAIFGECSKVLGLESRRSRKPCKGYIELQRHTSPPSSDDETKEVMWADGSVTRIIRSGGEVSVTDIPQPYDPAATCYAPVGDDG